MSLRTVTIDFTAESPISKKEIGLIGEHNATTLNIIPPIDMSTNANISTYIIAFQTGNGTVLHSKPFARGEEITVDLWQQLTLSATLGVQLEGNDSTGNLIAKSRFIRGLVFMPSPCGVEGEVDTGNDSLISAIAENTKARHTHDNKSTLDRLGVGADGNLTFDGKPIESGGGAVPKVGGIYAVTPADELDKAGWQEVSLRGSTVRFTLNTTYLNFVSENLTASKDYLWINGSTTDTKEPVWVLGLYKRTVGSRVEISCISSLIGVGGSSNVYVGEAEPTDENAEVWINPHAEVGTGYPLVKTKTVQCPSEGGFYYNSTFLSAFVTIKNTETDKLIPPNAKIIGVDFVVAGVHYYNSEIRKFYPTAPPDTAFIFEFFPRHNSLPIEGTQAIAVLPTQSSSNIVYNISQAGGLTEFTVYYFEELGDLAVVRVKGSNGEWQYATTASGEKGDTPIRGVDYWTASDKQEIVNSVLQSLPKWTGGNF